MKLYRRTRLAVLSVSLSLGLSAYAAGPVTGFEPADPTPTPVAGDASVRTTFQGVTPPSGSNQYLITTISANDAGDGFSPISGTNAVPNATLSSTLHVTPPALSQEGSGFLLPFTVSAGDQILTFQYDFLTNEIAPGNHNDIAFAWILNSSNTLQGSVQTITTANLAQASLVQLSDQSTFQFHTTYQLFSMNVSALAPGNYQLGIAVTDRSTTDIPSGLLVDNIQIVPEPSTLGLAIAGAALMMAVRRRLKA
jgi:hypothetical protein